MAMTDPIADMLTRVRNAVTARHKEVIVPGSKIKGEIAKILKDEGFISDFSVEKQGAASNLRIALKYGENNAKVITEIKRISKPGRRVYVAGSEIPNVMNGLGVCILSTSKGVLSDKKAKEMGVGGELICSLY